MRRPGSQTPFYFKVLESVEVRALCGPNKFFHTKPIKFGNQPKPDSPIRLSNREAGFVRTCSTASEFNGGVLYITPCDAWHCT